ncbi:mitochondrial 37S ribosomal protein uS10m [Aspergillus candidus]|uniref:Small ribosomal subunit protein uS10m n=1 Tax=Aspergillus candidus TaxID=41067 RepID=A0A2I2F1I5_ASPCN|nr:putative ribosomal protein S10p/S20e [Aspergillus candidus]PLB34502.1 putative ribosomal protein S10p/S20e [Aspergillus candidus]
MSLLSNPCLISGVGRHIQFSVPMRNLAFSALNKSNQATVPRRGISSTESESKKDTISPPDTSSATEWSERLDSLSSRARLPRSVQAVYLRPLRRASEYGLPSCDLQLRSYSVRNVEFFADFAIRAAYYLRLPVSGPVPLPRIVERWTFPRSNFVHKKSQENFERITLRRLIQIKDGNPEVVQTWLAFLRKHAFYGVGMKANVWEHETLDVARNLDESTSDVEKSLEHHLSQFGRRKDGEALGSLSNVLDAGRLAHNQAPLANIRRH